MGSARRARGTSLDSRAGGAIRTGCDSRYIGAASPAGHVPAASTMNDSEPESGWGKVSISDLTREILPHLGAPRPEVLVGPGPGVDAAVVRCGPARVLAATSDPLSLIPGLGPDLSARLACHLLASDLWTSGIPPAWVLVDLTLPAAMSDADLGLYWRAMSDEWAALGVAVIGGHTGRYPGGGFPIVGSAALLGIGDEGRTVGASFVAPGDVVIVTKGCAMEVAYIAARAFPERLAGYLEPEGVALAGSSTARVSVVADCRAALRVGVRDRGVTSLHDATEGGVVGGLVELARATGHDLRIEQARLPLPEECRAACAMFDIDPYVSVSEGALIATVRPGSAEAVIAALAEESIPAVVVGEVMRGHAALWLTGLDGKIRKLDEVPADPYWSAYARAVREGWR